VDAARLRGDPEALLRLLVHPGVFRAMLGPPDAGRWAVPASPFLVFAAFVQQTAAELAQVDHVAGTHRAAPVGAGLRRARAAGLPRRAVSRRPKTGFALIPGT
jgi:hypothetical protein